MKKIFFYINLLFLFACTGNQFVKHGTPLLLKTGDKPENTQYFKRYFTLESILPIETTNTFLMADIQRIIAYKDKFIILDNLSGIFVVNYATGKIETYIKRIGSGPGEWSSIMDIAIDEHAENILAFTDYRQLLFFDMQGNFLKQETFKKLYSCMIWDNGNILFYNYGEGYSCYPYLIEKYNLQAKTWEEIGKKERLEFPRRLYGRHIVKSKNIWFGSPLDFDLNCLKNMEIECPYKLSPTTNSLKKETMQLLTSNPSAFFDQVAQNNIMYGICSIRETEHYLLFISSHAGFFILNKATHEIHWEDYVNEKALGLHLLNYFPHDGDDNRIMFIVSPNEWVNFRKTPYMDDISLELQEKINSTIIKGDNNPILVFYREKKIRNE
jgi:hypothetical protein